MVTLYRGNDVDFADIAEIYVCIRSGMDLTGFTGRFDFLGVTKTFPKKDIERRHFSFSYTSEETSRFCPGRNFGTFTLFDPQGRKALVEKICINVELAGGGGSCDCPGGKRIFMTMEKMYDYRGLLHKPSINGVTVTGDKTGKDYGLPDAADIALHRRYTQWVPTPAQESGEEIVLLFNSAERAWVPFRGDVQIGNGKGTEDSESLHWDLSELYGSTLSSLDARREALDAYVLGNQLNKPLQGVLTFDDKPTEGSKNPVTSGGVYEAIKQGGMGDITGEDIPLHPDSGESSDDSEEGVTVTEAIERNADALSEIDRALDDILAEEDSSEDSSEESSEDDSDNSGN